MIQALPRRKTVTLISAWRCKGGIVLHADSQETNGYYRVTVQKLNLEPMGSAVLAPGSASRSVGGECETQGDQIADATSLCPIPPNREGDGNGEPGFNVLRLNVQAFRDSHGENLPVEFVAAQFRRRAGQHSGWSPADGRG